MIICAGESEQFNFAKSMGIGLIDISINLTQECITNRPKSILFVGSAGSYGNKKIFDIVESNSATNIENSFFNANSYSPIDNTILQKNITDKIFVNSSNYITTDFNLAKSYLSKNIEIENMEFYAVVKVAQKFNIPVRGIFIVTNYCNKNAHKEFLRNHKEAMQKLTEYIIIKNRRVLQHYS
jgi:nucleoside phosphorylase